jgi:hypothetical protein
VSADPADFWRWFAANERRMRTPGRRPPERVLDAVLERLCAYHPGLGFEVYQDADGGDDRRFIVTAYGDRASFPAVDALVAAAPDGLGWRAIALKPEKGFDFVQERGGRTYDPKEMWFDPLAGSGTPFPVHLRVYVEGYREDAVEEQGQAVDVALLTALGERRYAEAVGRVVVAPLTDAARTGEPLPLVQLPDYLAWKERRHSGR